MSNLPVPYPTPYSGGAYTGGTPYATPFANLFAGYTPPTGIGTGIPGIGGYSPPPALGAGAAPTAGAGPSIMGELPYAVGTSAAGNVASTPVMRALAAGPAAAASRGATAGGATAGGGFTNSILSDLPFATSGGGGGGWMSNFANAFKNFGGPEKLGGTGDFGWGGLAARVAPGLATAMYGPKLINASGIGTQDQRDIVGNIVAGAGMGGTGFALGPEVGIPTTIAGALLGGAKGVGEYFFGEDPNKNTKDLKDTLTGYGAHLGVANTNDWMTKFDLYKKMGMTGQDGKPLTDNQIAQGLATQMESEVATKNAQNQASAQSLAMHEADLKYNMAAQQQAKDYFAPYVNGIVAGGQTQHDTLMQLANSVPSEYKGVFQQQASDALSSSQKIAGAYMGQMLSAPTMQVMDSYAQRDAQQQDKLNQALSLAVQLAGKQGGASGGVNFNNLANQATAGSGSTSPTGINPGGAVTYGNG